MARKKGGGSAVPPGADTIGIIAVGVLFVNRKRGRLRRGIETGGYGIRPYGLGGGKPPAGRERTPRGRPYAVAGRPAKTLAARKASQARLLDDRALRKTHKP